MKCSRVLHPGLRGRSYRVEDFVGPLNQAGVWKNLAGLKTFQMGDVWLLKLHDVATKEKLLNGVTLLVKERPYLVIDPINENSKVKIH